MDLYRFRSMEYLLGDEYQELEKENIYFASPDELNDPMEGLRDIVWKGDKIVWTNLFKHYVYCLNASYPLHRTIDDSLELDAFKLPVEGRWDRLRTPQEYRFRSVWNRFHNLSKVPDVIEELSDTNRKIRYRELEYYLRTIQQPILAHMIFWSLEDQPIPDFTKEQLFEEISGVAKESLESILIALAQFEKDSTDEEVDSLLCEEEERLNNERTNQLLKSPDMKQKLEDMDQLFFDFPKKYLNEIEALLWPNWYTACFMEDYYNSSVWGNYGDGHRGACLIFGSVKPDGSNNFQLYQMADEDDNAILPRTTIPFSKVSYAKQPGKVDFFRSIGRLEKEDVVKLWYTDENDNVSECGAHLLHDSDTYNWREDYWENFYRDVTTKTKDWEYEQEYRLILRDGAEEFSNEQSRKLRYDFNSLKGIIFGIKTSDEDKLSSIKIIEEKRKKYKRTNFKFYQAYYSEKTGDIRKYKIQLT